MNIHYSDHMVLLFLYHQLADIFNTFLVYLLQ